MTATTTNKLNIKRYYSISEVSEICGVKPHVLRFWEQEFTQLKPEKRAGNRRYYRHKDVLVIQEIQHLLYDLGFTIQGARQHLTGLKKDKLEASFNRQIINKTIKELEALLSD